MKTLVFCLLSVLVAGKSFGQVSETNPLPQLQQHFENYRKHQPEKIYLHTDRTFYAAGDTVWCKAYLVDPQTHRPHPVSEILYLNLISEDNQSIISQRLRSEDGSKATSLILPDTLRTGNYMLQVYTNWQRNAGPGAFCRQPIYINKVPLQAGIMLGKKAEKLPQQISFYPEGGKLITGFAGKVAFKAIDVDGKALPVDGKIQDETGKTVTTFRSNSSGTGSFILKPQAGKNYKALITQGGGVKEFPLEVSGKGYALSLKHTPDSITVTISSSGADLPPVYLILQSHGSLLQADSVMFNAKGLRKKRFIASDFPEGIVQVSLLNAEMQPENERLFFHKEAHPFKLKLDTEKKVYGRREPVKLDINLTDEAGKPVEAEFSIAATSYSTVPLFSLRQRMLLSSELGQIADQDIEQADDLDDLLLTVQLRNFSWNALRTGVKTTPAFARESDVRLLGTVSANNAPVNNAVIYLLETNSGKTHLLTSDGEGKVRMPIEGNRFFYQIWQNGIWRQDARLAISMHGDVLPTGNWDMITSTDPAETKRLLLGRQIERMYAQDSLKEKVKFVNKDAWPAYPADHYYPLEEYNQLNTIEEILREMVPSVRVVNRKKKVFANVYNEDTRTFYPNQPLYIIDGQPTWNNDLFLRLDASQLEQVNIYNSSKTLQPFGFMGNNGVIVVFTKSHNYQNPDLSTEYTLTVPKQTSSDLFVRKPRPANIPDFRPTLYWNPNVKTSAEGKATINFQSSDEMGNLRVQVEGMTKDGKLISEQLLIPVRPAE